MKKIIRRLTQSLLLASLVALTVCRLEAADLNLPGTNMPPLDFHGFVSQGFLATTKYNYLGDNTKDGSFKFTEAGLNVSMDPFPRTRVAAQAFTYDIGEQGRYDVVLDYASIQYTVNDYFGVRAGRIRRPQGIYNDIQDVDLARTFVLLPQGMYDARYRDFYCTVDGGEFFGNIPLSLAGDLSYEAYAGLIHIATDGGVAEQIRAEFYPAPQNLAYLVDIHQSIMGGIQLWYSPPVEGLRVGISENYISGISYDVYVSPAVGGPGAEHVEGNIFAQAYSLEYVWENWTFQSEYFQYHPTVDGYVAGQNVGSVVTAPDSWYVSAAYRFNQWLEAGSYYTEYYEDVTQRGNPLDYQKDVALTVRFDPKPWWTFKVEGHYVRGTGLLHDPYDNPPSQQGDQGWFMIMVKTTFSF